MQVVKQSSADCVPIYGQIHEYAMASSGISATEFYTNGRILVESVMETAQRHGLDDPHIGYDTYNIEAEALGMEVRFFEDKVPELVNKPLLKERTDLKHLHRPIPVKMGECPL